MSQWRNLRDVPIVPFCILAALAAAVCLIFIPQVSTAAPNPEENSQRTPAPLQFPPPLPYSTEGLYPPGLEPHSQSRPVRADTGITSAVKDPPGDLAEATLGWPYQGANYGVSVSGKQIEVAAHVGHIDGSWWYGALFQDVSGTLQERDHAPNDSVLALSSESGLDDEYGDASPVWMDLSNVRQKCCTADGRRVFTASLWAEIPASAWDMIFTWPIYDYSGHLQHILMAYQGPVGWEQVVSSAFLPTNIGEADIYTTTVRRGPDGWIELELVSGLTAIEPYPSPYFGVSSWHALYRWYFDSDDNPYTGAPSGADIAVELRQNAQTRTYEALVLRWGGKFWVTQNLLAQPSFNATAHTTLIRVGPATLGLATDFAWWLSSSMWIGWNRDIDIANPWVTNQIDRAPNAGVVVEGAPFWVIPTRTPTPTPTPTRTPTRTSTPAAMQIQGAVRQGSYNFLRGPISDATVFAERKDGSAWSLLEKAETNSDGHYAMTIYATRSANYRIRCVYLGPLGYREQTAEYTNVTPGSADLGTDFYFEPIIRVRGQIIGADGMPGSAAALKRIDCFWYRQCITWPESWQPGWEHRDVPIDLDGRFDSDALSPAWPPDSIRLKLFPPDGQRVASVSVPDGCEAVAINIVECADLTEGIYDGVDFTLAPALTPTPTPTTTPTGPWIAWMEPDNVPIGMAGRTANLRFEALPYTDTLTVTLGPGLKFSDGTTEKSWLLRVLRGRMPVTVSAEQASLGQQSWIRATLLGMEDTLPVSLVWQAWLPGTFRYTGWRDYAFGIRFLEARTNTPTCSAFTALETCASEPCGWQSLQDVWSDSLVVWEPEGTKLPFKFRIRFATTLDCADRAYVLDHVVVDGQGVLGDGEIVYDNPPSGRYTKNIVYMRRVP